MQELYRHDRSLIHQLEPRVKVIFTLAFILSLSLTPYNAWPAYILFLTLVFSATLLSRLGIGFVLKRAMLAVPFVFAAVPLVFTGPPPYLEIAISQTIHVGFSPVGFERFASITLKSWISVQAAILLAATTRVPDLLSALSQLKVPRLFVAIVGLMWRYLFVISEEALRMLRARSSRSASLAGSHPSGGSLLWRARVTGGMAGSLFLRSLERSDRIYAAMLSRGYNGELPVSTIPTLSRRDRRLLAFGLSILTVLWLLGLLTGG